MERNTVAILTLERHRDGIWIDRLVEALLKRVNIVGSGTPLQIKVVALENYLQTPFCVSRPATSSWMAIVNRVSDAAEPWEVKATMAVLQLARHVWKIPIWNGPDAYSLFTNKWCHHVFFAQAGLSSPDTVAALERGNNLAEIKSVQMLTEISTKKSLHDGSEEAKSFDYLIKPNAGGFGAGIERRSAEKSELVGSDGTKAEESTPPKYSDRMTLFQKYMAALGGKIYRVWFLSGKVQCAVERTPSADEFTSGCAGSGSCVLKANGTETRLSSPAVARGWTVPDDVRVDIEEKLLPMLPKDAHCGSVEFLYTTSKSNYDAERLYFDLNLLSTLPLDNDSTGNPWELLANSIWEFISV